MLNGPPATFAFFLNPTRRAIIKRYYVKEKTFARG
jgi:hypothetical protein